MNVIPSNFEMKVLGPKRSRMMPPPGLQIYLRPPASLTFDLLIPKVDRFVPFHSGPVVGFIRFQNIVFVSSATDERTDGRTDRSRTTMPLRVSLPWRRHKTRIYELTRNTFCRTRSLSNATFSFLITWRSSSSKAAAVYKISSKSDDFSLRYGDISIFKMTAVHHLGSILPSYETIYEVSVAGRSCLSNFMSIRYTDLKIQLFENYSHIWLEMPIQAPKMRVLGDFGPLNVIIHHRDPQKAHPCINPRLLSYQL